MAPDLRTQGRGRDSTAPVNRRLTRLTVLATVVVSTALVTAQQPPRYVVPRTEFGQPDFQGAWATDFLTTLERMPGATALTVSPEQAKALATAFLEKGPALTDP